MMVKYDIKNNSYLETKFFYSSSIKKIMEFIRSNKEKFICKPIIIDLD